MLLSAPRSGSTLLVEMLRTHGDVVMHGEPFHEQDLRASRKDGLARNVTVDDAAFRRRRERPQELLEALGKQHANRRVVGFKLFSKHLDWKRLDTFLDWATHLILLRRDDAFAQYVSICLAQASNVWAAYPGSAKHDHVVSVDAALFDTWSKHEAAFVETVERALAKAANPPGVLHLTYERDLCAPHARRDTMRRVERFLGVAADRARADAEHLPIKQHKVDVRDHVSNFEHVARVLPAANASAVRGPASRRDGGASTCGATSRAWTGSARRLPRTRGPRRTLGAAAGRHAVAPLQGGGTGVVVMTQTCDYRQGKVTGAAAAPASARRRTRPRPRGRRHIRWAAPSRPTAPRRD